MNEPTQRQFLPNFAELIDRMTVTQIKLNLVENGKDDFKEELRKISRDLDLILSTKLIKLSGDLILIFITIAQLNLHIWNNKDKMQENPQNEEEYLRLLKLSHQLNGFRNQLKNQLLLAEGISDKSQLRSNFETDGLNFEMGL
jgi:hypothetical protein